MRELANHTGCDLFRGRRRGEGLRGGELRCVDLVMQRGRARSWGQEQL